MIDDRVESLMKYLRTPKDWNTIKETNRAEILVLSFIGYVARPINIPKKLLEDVIVAFNNNRGKVETEVEAVQKVLDKYKEEK